jgi:hypothetical protein
MELIQISEKLLGSAKVLESSEGVHM